MKTCAVCGQDVHGQVARVLSGGVNPVDVYYHPSCLVIAVRADVAVGSFGEAKHWLVPSSEMELLAAAQC